MQHQESQVKTLQLQHGDFYLKLKHMERHRINIGLTMLQLYSIYIIYSYMVQIMSGAGHRIWSSVIAAGCNISQRLAGFISSSTTSSSCCSTSFPSQVFISQQVESWAVVIIYLVFPVLNTNHQSYIFQSQNPYPFPYMITLSFYWSSNEGTNETLITTISQE